MYAGVGLTVNDFATRVKIIKQVRNELAHPCNEHGIPYTPGDLPKNLLMFKAWS